MRIGSAIRCILEQCDPICELIRVLAKDDKKASRTNCYKQASAMLIGVEKDVTKATLEYFFNNVINYGHSEHFL